MNATRMLVAFGGLILHAGGASAQDGIASPLVTDRPGNGNASRVVAAKRLQIETSAQYVYDRPSEATFHQLSLPTWLRLGLTDVVELRLAGSIAGLQTSNGETQARWSDLYLGTKVQLLDSASQPTDLALGIDVELPTGPDSLGSNELVPETRLLNSWSLPAGLGLLLNAGIDLPTLAERRVARFVQVVNLNFVLPWWNQQLSVFVEYFSKLPLSFDDTAIVQLDAGIAWLVHDDLQLDLFSQHAFTDASADLTLSVGCSLRL